MLTNLTAMNLSSGWHTLELHLFQRSQRPTYFMAPRSCAHDWSVASFTQDTCVHSGVQALV